MEPCIKALPDNDDLGIILPLETQVSPSPASTRFQVASATRMAGIYVNLCSEEKDVRNINGHPV